MRHRSTALLGVLAGDGWDLRDLLGGELARGTAPGPVARQSLDRARQGGRLLAAFDQDQALEGIGPAVPPWADRMTFTSDVLGDVRVGEAVEGQEDHPCPLGDGLRTGAGARHAVQDRLLPSRDDELACPPWHRFRLPVLDL
jgi:hypothetical protein